MTSPPTHSCEALPLPQFYRSPAPQYPMVGGQAMAAPHHRVSPYAPYLIRPCGVERLCPRKHEAFARTRKPLGGAPSWSAKDLFLVRGPASHPAHQNHSPLSCKSSLRYGRPSSLVVLGGSAPCFRLSSADCRTAVDQAHVSICYSRLTTTAWRLFLSRLSTVPWPDR